jgi:hypothetical protein
MRCPEPIVARGRFRYEAKRVYTVEARAEHAGELETC